jgi:hypothetical protein
MGSCIYAAWRGLVFAAMYFVSIERISPPTALGQCLCAWHNIAKALTVAVRQAQLYPSLFTSDIPDNRRYIETASFWL